MTATSATRALGASALALLVACAGIAAFLPPMQEATLASWSRMALFGSAIVAGMALHWVFVGKAAQRLGRSVAGWVSLAVLLFPIGGATALMLLRVDAAAPAPAPARGM